MKLKHSGFILFLATILIFSITSCEDETVQRPVNQYQVKYEIKNHLKKKCNFYIRYFNPKFDNIVAEYYDSINEWSRELKGKTFDHLYFEAFTVRDSAMFEISIYVNGHHVVRDVDSCPGPSVCDTNRIKVSYVLQ